jgi:hypothetical protein
MFPCWYIELSNLFAAAFSVSVFNLHEYFSNVSMVSPQPAPEYGHFLFLLFPYISYSSHHKKRDNYCFCNLLKFVPSFAVLHPKTQHPSYLITERFWKKLFHFVDIVHHPKSYKVSLIWTRPVSLLTLLLIRLEVTAIVIGLLTRSWPYRRPKTY